MILSIFTISWWDLNLIVIYNDVIIFNIFNIHIIFESDSIKEYNYV